MTNEMYESYRIRRVAEEIVSAQKAAGYVTRQFPESGRIVLPYSVLRGLGSAPRKLKKQWGLWSSVKSRAGKKQAREDRRKYRAETREAAMLGFKLFGGSYYTIIRTLTRNSGLRSIFVNEVRRLKFKHLASVLNNPEVKAICAAMGAPPIISGGNPAQTIISGGNPAQTIISVESP